MKHISKLHCMFDNSDAKGEKKTIYKGDRKWEGGSSEKNQGDLMEKVTSE